MNIVLDLTAQYVDFRIGSLFDLFISTKVVAVLVAIVVVLRIRKVISDRLAQRKANTYAVPPTVDLWNDTPASTFSDFDFA